MSHQDYPASLADFISRFQLQQPQAMQISHNSRPAAVLIPIVCRPEPTLLLTRRADSLRKHAGQVAFPGGKTDAEDGSPIITALREAQEEVAIPPQRVHILGQLAPLDSSTGFQVTPVVGLIPADVAFHANEDEVAERCTKHCGSHAIIRWIFIAVVTHIESIFPGIRASSFGT